MFDRYQREIHYLRLSVTDLCNLRCRYCMPDGVEKLEREAVLTYEEFLRLAALFAQCGIDTVRVTGGEPLVRKNVAQLVAGLKATPGIRRVTLTTNAVLLEEQLPALLDAGLDSVNISLDTPVYYICRRVLADNTPVLFSTDIVPCSLFGTTRTDGIDFTRPIFDILDEACGIQVSSTITHLRAAMGDPAVRHALALQRDQALLELSETCYSRLCRPVLRCRTFYTDFFDFALVRKLV